MTLAGPAAPHPHPDPVLSASSRTTDCCSAVGLHLQHSVILGLVKTIHSQRLLAFSFLNHKKVLVWQPVKTRTGPPHEGLGLDGRSGPYLLKKWSDYSNFSSPKLTRFWKHITTERVLFWSWFWHTKCQVLKWDMNFRTNLSVGPIKERIYCQRNKELWLCSSFFCPRLSNEHISFAYISGGNDVDLWITLMPFGL